MHSLFRFRKQSPAPSISTSSDQPPQSKKKAKQQQKQQQEPEKPVETAPQEPPKPASSQQTTEAKREKHRNKKQAQRTSKRAEAAALAAVALSNSGRPEPISPPSPIAPPSPPHEVTVATNSRPGSIASYDPPASFDSDIAYWETSPFDLSPDASGAGNASEWLSVHPGSSSKGHRNALPSDQSSSAAGSDWRSTGPSVSSSGTKRKVSLSVSKHDIGKIIGQGGAVVSALRTMSGIQIDIESARGDDVTERMVYLKGSQEMVDKTLTIIRDLLGGLLAGTDVIAMSKGIKVTPTPSVPTTYAPNIVASASSATIVPTPRAGSTTSRKVTPTVIPTPPAPAATKTQSMQPSMPSLQSLPTKLITPIGMKPAVATSNNNASSAKATASWGGSVTAAAKPATQKGNFAAVAAAGVAPPQQKEGKKNKTGIHGGVTTPGGAPVSLLSVTLASLGGSEAASVFSTASTTILDEQSFPPLSTAATCVTSAATPKEALGKAPGDSAPRKMSLPTPQTEERPAMTSLPSRIPERIPPPNIGSGMPLQSQVEMSLPQRSVANLAHARMHPAPIGSSRPFARAPGSERSAHRNAGAMPSASNFFGAIGSTSLADSVGLLSGNPTKRTPTTFGSDTDREMFSQPKPPTSLSMAAPHQQPSPGHLDSLFAAATAASQHQLSGSNQFLTGSSNNNTSSPMWSDFTTSGGNTGAFGSSSFDYADNPPQPSSSLSNYAHLLQSNLGARNFNLDDPHVLYPPHLQSSYRLSQQSGGGTLGGLGGSGGSKMNGSDPLAAALAASRNATFQQQQQQRDFSLYNGMPNGSTGGGPSAFHHSRLNPHQQMVPPMAAAPQQQQQPKPQQPTAFMHHQTTPSPYGLGLSAQQAGDYLGGGPSYPGEQSIFIYCMRLCSKLNASGFHMVGAHKTVYQDASSHFLRAL